MMRVNGDVTTKVCCRCGMEKSIDHFYRNDNKEDGFRVSCKECEKEYQKQWYEKNKERLNKKSKDYNERNKEVITVKARRVRIKRIYGIEEDTYTKNLELQGGACAICGSTYPGGNSKGYFHIDHCHETGQFRGLLCGRCNTSLGGFKDDINILKKAIEYLEQDLAI